MIDERAALRDADVLFIVPPFAWPDRPALGVHLLQAVARRAGVEAQVLYANLSFAAIFGEKLHMSLARLQHGLFLGERLFARAAFGGPALGRDGGAPLEPALDAIRAAWAKQGMAFDLDLARVRALEARMPEWIERIARAVTARPRLVVGCTSSFEQNSCSAALVDAIKRLRPEIVTAVGGANCEGEMAEGIVSLGCSADHVFSGESEHAFAEFLAALRRGDRPASRIVRGEPCRDLDALPTPDFADYHAQHRAFVPGSPFGERNSFIAYETSRGCWWGQKSHCTFCGLNGQGMASREKSPARVLEELRALVSQSPSRRVVMTDNIMPHSYFRTLLPHLQRELPGIEVMYEEKANLSLAHVQALMSAGVREIQPGIEALSTGLLRLMGKGTTCAQNLALLRYARATGLKLHWNLLCGFPNDALAFYVETLELVPFVHHLHPPNRLNPVIFDRFSPYHDRPQQYGIRQLRPLPFYAAVFPEHAAVDKLAYHFEAEFPSESLANKPLLRQLADAVITWRARHFSAARPELSVRANGDGSFLLVDTRGLAGLAREERIDAARASTALTSRRITAATRAEYQWALERKLVVERDGRFVPLAVAEPQLLSRLEARAPSFATVPSLSCDARSPTTP